jgi:hypothetical protein
VAQQCAAGRREGDATALALEQREAVAFLQLAQRLGDGRLRDAQRPRCAAHAAAAGHGDEVAHLVQLHGGTGIGSGQGVHAPILHVPCHARMGG